MVGFPGVISRAIKAASLAALITFPAMSMAQAQDPLILKFGTTLPGKHYLSERLLQKFMDDVEKATDSKVKFEFYPAAQLGKDTFTLMESGVLDFGQVITGLNPQKFPLSSVSELPVVAETACQANAKMWSLSKEGGFMDEVEYKPNGVRVLAVSLLPQYVLYTRNKKVEKLSDVAGLKVWVSGPAMEKAVLAMNAVPIRIPSPELYDAASRGTVDAAIFPYSGFTQYSLEKVLSHAVNGIPFGTGYSFIGITNDRWNRLSEEHRKIVAEKAQEAQWSFCKWLDESNEQMKEQVRAVPGYSMVDLDGAAKEEFIQALSKVGDDWAATMESTGKKGAEALKAFRDASGDH